MYSFQTIHIAALAFLLLCAALITTPGASHADEDIDVNQRIETLETENAQLKSLIESMQKRLDALDGGGKAEEEKKDSDKKKKKKEKNEDDGIREKDAPWLQSINNEYFRLGGRLRFGYFDVENETDLPSGIPENPGGSFTLNDFRLKLDADFTDGVSFASKFDTSHSEGENALVEAYVDFSDLILSSELRAGLQPAFWRPSRFTKYYPISGRAFWAKRDLGVTWKGDWAPVNVYASVSNGFPLDNTSLGEDDSNEIIGTDVNELDFDDSRELSVGAGYELDFDDYGKLDILGFGVFGNLDEDDLDFLRVKVPGYGISQRDSRRWWGVNLEYDIAEWDFFAQAIGARDGELERFAWYAEGSYKFDIDDIKYLQAVRPLVRYSSLDTNLTARPYSFGGSFTWDREQWMFALISELTDNVFFRTEYALNLEETGGPDSSNNELLLLLTVEF